MLAWNYGLTGKGVKVGIIDSGVDPNYPDRIVGKKTFIEGEDYGDIHGHGTQIAGVVAAKNNKFALIGVAHEVDIYALKVGDEFGEAWISDIIQAIEWSIKND